MQDVLALILGGGRGARLYPLTKQRAEPAVPLAGKYRLIDVPISNCLNSCLNRIYVLTQFSSVSLHRHLANTYKFGPFSQGFVEVLAAQQTYEAADWYGGTADALRQNIRYIEGEKTRDVLVLSGDQLYRMDFRNLVRDHRQRQADLTLAVLPVGRERTHRVGVFRLDENRRLVGLAEKPQTEQQLQALRMSPAWLAAQGVTDPERPYLANMGIYLFRRQALIELLTAQSAAVDLIQEILPRVLDRYRIQGHVFDGYWEDLGTVRSYFEANLALASPEPPFNFHTHEGVIYTRMRYLPASRILDARVQQALISDGCVVEAGVQLERCIIGVRSRIGRNARLRDTILIGVDRYETETEMADDRRRGIPHFGIGDDTIIERAIVDKDCRIGRNVRILDHGDRRDGEGPYHVTRDGIIVIPNGTVIPDGTVL